MKYILFTYRVLLIIVFLLFFSWLAFQNIVISGKLHLVKDFCTDSDFISDLRPENRVGEIEKGGLDTCYQRIFVEPAYIKIKVPRTFNSAIVKITYSNPDEDIFQLGLMKKRINPLDWKFTLRLIENKVFDNLDWYKLTEQGVTLWQKQKKFDSIYDYVNNVPTDQKTTTFYYKFSPEAIKNPTKVVGWNLKTPLEYVDYIIAQYKTALVVDSLSVDKYGQKQEWREQTLEFLVGPDYMNDHALEFMLSAPELTENRNEIKVGRFEIELIRPATDWPTFLSDVKDYFIRKLGKLTL